MIFKRNIYDIFIKFAVCLIILMINSCVNYKPVRFLRTINIINYDKEKLEKDNRAGADFSSYYLSANDGKKGYIADNKRKGTPVYTKRFFAEVISSRPIAKINNRGVEYALNGKFMDARFIFEETLKEDNKFAPAYNNLGIIFELFKKKYDAFRMYSKACILDPENEYYRNNFLNSQE